MKEYFNKVKNDIDIGNVFDYKSYIYEGIVGFRRYLDVFYGNENLLSKDEISDLVNLLSNKIIHDNQEELSMNNIDSNSIGNIYTALASSELSVEEIKSNVKSSNLKNISISNKDKDEMSR